VIPKPCQHSREHRFQREHQRRTCAAGALQPPGQGDGADDRAEERHRGKPLGVTALNSCLPVNRTAQQGADQRRSGIQQSRSRETADACPEALHKRRTGAEEHGGQQGDEAAAQRWQVERC
jgi:hypothetical protein